MSDVVPSVAATLNEGVLVLKIIEPNIHGDAMAETIRHQMLTALEKSGGKRVVVDFSHVEMMGTVGFRPLLSLRRRLHEKGGSKLYLAGLSPLVEETFRVTRLISSGGQTAPFEVQPDVATAIKAMQA